MTEERVPPRDLDCEAAVLSAAMLDESALDKVLAFLKPEHFYAERHRRVFEAAVELRNASQPVDIVTVGTWLKDRERLEQVGGMAYLTQILDAAPVVSNVETYGRTIHEKYRVRQVIASCQRTAAQGYLDYGDAQKFLSAHAEDAHKIAYDGIVDGRTVLLKTAIGEAVKKIQLAAARKGVVGTPTGLHRLDKYTGGLHDSDLTIVAARPGMGKTSLVLNVVANVASHVGDEIAGGMIFSLEMPRDQLANRMAFAEARVDVSKARSGDMTPVDWQKLTMATNHLGPLPIWIDDQPAISLTELRAKVRAKQAEFNRPATDEKRARRLVVVAVDYLQLMSTSGAKGMNRDQEIGELTRGLKRLAKECGVAVIVLSQLNRSVESRADKRPQLSDLRESGNIEQDADNIVFIYRDDYYTKEASQEKNVAELIIAKQRNGPTGFVKVRFDSEYTRFDNLAEGWGDDGQ